MKLHPNRHHRRERSRATKASRSGDSQASRSEWQIITRESRRQRAQRERSEARSARLESKFNEAKAVLYGKILTGVAAIAVACSAIFMSADSPVLFKPNKQKTVADRELSDVLKSLHAAWEPKERERILAAAPERANKFKSAMRRYLRLGKPPILERAVEYAGAMGVPDLRDVLEDLATSDYPGARYQAVLAAERLRKWEVHELSEFLSQDERVLVQVAALKVIAKRDDGPWKDVYRLLTSVDPEVRDAASKALPACQLGGDANIAWGSVTAAGPGPVAAAVQSMAGNSLLGKHESELLALLKQGNPEVAIAALEVLAGRGKRLDQPDKLWEVVEDLQADPAVRAKALFCFESTRSVDIKRLERNLTALQGPLAYFAARCYLAAGKRKGAEILLRLMRSDDHRLKIASRRLLAWLTGRSPVSEADAFRLAMPTRERFEQRTILPPPDIELKLKA